MLSGTMGNEHVPASERVLGQDRHTQMRIHCHCDLFCFLGLCITSAQLFLSSFYKTHKMPRSDCGQECVKILFPIIKTRKRCFLAFRKLEAIAFSCVP